MNFYFKKERQTLTLGCHTRKDTATVNMMLD